MEGPTRAVLATPRAVRRGHRPHEGGSSVSRCLNFVAVLVVFFAMSGCGDDKITPPIIQPRIYPILSNPYNVMDALKTAYERRDTVEIKVLYDDAYQGTSICLLYTSDAADERSS